MNRIKCSLSVEFNIYEDKSHYVKMVPTAAVVTSLQVATGNNLEWSRSVVTGWPSQCDYNTADTGLLVLSYKIHMLQQPIDYSG